VPNVFSSPQPACETFFARKISALDDRVSESLLSDSLDSDRNRHCEAREQRSRENFFHMLNRRASSGIAVRFRSLARAARKPIKLQREKAGRAKTPMESAFFRYDAEQQCICRA
jgi:hypothetical protein